MNSFPPFSRLSGQRNTGSQNATLAPSSLSNEDIGLDGLLDFLLQHDNDACNGGDRQQPISGVTAGNAREEEVDKSGSFKGKKELEFRDDFLDTDRVLAKLQVR